MSSWSDKFPWQYKLATYEDHLLKAEDIERRQPYWRQDDAGVLNDEQNAAVRLRSYASDGHDERQEGYFAVSQGSGTVIRGNDSGQDKSSHISYADVLLHIGESFHVQVPKDGLAWNYTTFNARLNPTFQMPKALADAQDAFDFVKSSVPGAEQFASAIGTTANPMLAIAGVDGFAKFDTPFNVYTSMTAQKIPLWNMAAIAFMQLLFQGGTQLWLCGPPGSPLVPSPKLLALLPLIKQDYTTGYGPSARGKVLGSELKDMLKQSVPGLNLIMG